MCQGGDFERLPTPGHWIGRKTFQPVAPMLGICRCRRCSLVFSNPRPGPELLNRFYGGDDYGCHTATYARDVGSVAWNIHRLMVRYLDFKPGLRLLDYGCGGGSILFELQKLGWDCEGYDIGPAALASSRALGLKVTSDLAALGTGRFDAVTMSHVIEHLGDPLDTLRGIGPLLAPGGRLFITTPNTASLRARLSAPLLSTRLNFDERYRAFPIHLFYYTPRTLPAMIAKAGFEMHGLVTYGVGLENLVIREYSRDSQPQPGPAQDTGGGRREPAGKRAAAGIKATIKGLLFRHNLGDNLLAVASR